jgi:hypothetical protein
VGVFVYSHPEADKPTQEAAQALAVALTTEGVHAEHKPQNPTNNPKHNRIKLIVGANR